MEYFHSRVERINALIPAPGKRRVLLGGQRVTEKTTTTMTPPGIHSASTSISLPRLDLKVGAWEAQLEVCKDSPDSVMSRSPSMIVHCSLPLVFVWFVDEFPGPFCIVRLVLINLYR